MIIQNQSPNLLSASGKPANQIQKGKLSQGLSFTGKEKLLQEGGKKGAALVDEIVFGKGKEGVLRKIYHMAESSKAIFESAVALVLTCALRPAVVMGMPGSSMEDKKYAAAQSAASGIVGFTTGYAIFKPIGKAAQKLIDIITDDNKPTPKHLKWLENKLKIDKKLKAADEPIQNELKELKNWITEEIDTIKKQTSDVIERKELMKKACDIYDANKAKLTKQLKSKTDFAAATKYIFDYPFKIVISPLMAGLTIGAIPVIMNLVGAKKGKKKPDANPQISQFNQLPANFHKDVFKSFLKSGVK